MKPTYLVLLFILLLVVQHRSFCQKIFLNNFSASGSTITSNNGILSYTIGQVFFSHAETDSHYLGEGVQQGYQQISSNNNEDIDTSGPSTLDILVYPNPTPDIVFLSFRDLDLETDKNSYQLYNYQGKLIMNNIIKSVKTPIDLTAFSSSIYILQVFIEEKLWKTIKIIKN